MYDCMYYGGQTPDLFVKLRTKYIPIWITKQNKTSKVKQTTTTNFTIRDHKLSAEIYLKW